MLISTFGFSKKKALLTWFLIIVASVLVIAGTYLYLDNMNKNNKSDDVTTITDLTEEDRLIQESQEEIDKALNSYQEENTNNIQTNLDALASVEDLEKIDTNSQGIVGVNKIIQLISEDNLEEANTYINYMMSKNDGYALEASRLCYQIAVNDERKNDCLKRMNELAVIQGIIEPGTSLPDSYYTQQEEQG